MEILKAGEGGSPGEIRVTNLTPGKRDENRVNVFLNGKFRFSLHVAQVVDLGVKVGKVVSEADIVVWQRASEFGKAYGRALEWALTRPRSKREVEDYLRKKTFEKKKLVKNRAGELEMKTYKGISQEVAGEILEKLVERGYVDDDKFARYWVESRNLRKGISRRKLEGELFAKGISKEVVQEVLAESERDDEGEMRKMIEKKMGRLGSEKMVMYLVRQGFSFDDAKEAVRKWGES